jgi:hypothetical protein
MATRCIVELFKLGCIGKSNAALIMRRVAVPVAVAGANSARYRIWHNPSAKRVLGNSAKHLYNALFADSYVQGVSNSPSYCYQ